MATRLSFVFGLALALALGAQRSLAMAVSDPAGDFLATYTGPKNGDVDVLSSDVVYNPTANTFTFSATFDAPVNTTPGTLYVWGLNRGAGAELLLGGTPPIGGGIPFDSVFIAVPGNGAGIVDVLDGSPATTLAGVVQVSGDSVLATVSAALFPSKGFPASSYAWNLWPRVGADNADNGQISDFAPDNTLSLVTVAPEPASLALVGIAALALGALRKLG